MLVVLSCTASGVCIGSKKKRREGGKSLGKKKHKGRRKLAVHCSDDGESTDGVCVCCVCVCVCC